jgi:hypothetical protein
MLKQNSRIKFGPKTFLPKWLNADSMKIVLQIGPSDLASCSGRSEPADAPDLREAASFKPASQRKRRTHFSAKVMASR